MLNSSGSIVARYAYDMYGRVTLISGSNLATNPSFARHKEHIRLAGCWAHVRRKVYAARDQDPLMAGWLMRQIRHLYRIERELRKSRSGPQLRAAVRAHQAKPIYTRLHRVLSRLKMKRRYLPRSGMGLALAYALNLWLPLGVYLGDGRVEIDQNLVENAIRPTALGKKNWLFIGEAEAGQRSAILYTIVECCRRRGIDPQAYLRDIFTRLPHATNWQIEDLTPEAWAGKVRFLSYVKPLDPHGSHGPGGSLLNGPPVPSSRSKWISRQEALRGTLTTDQHKK